MDPHFRRNAPLPPDYSQIQQHRHPSEQPQLPPAPIEANEMGPTIQQGIIQRPVRKNLPSVSTGA